jgi:cytochrome c-type biogenesis protein CcmH
MFKGIRVLTQNVELIIADGVRVADASSPFAMDPTTDDLDILRHRLAQLDALVAEGTLSDATAADARQDLQRQIVAAVMAGGVPTAGAAPRKGTGQQRDAVRFRPSMRLLGGLLVVVLGVAGAAYLWMGRPDALQNRAGSEAPAVDVAPHGTDGTAIQATIDRLSERLKSQPDDAAGWAMLARSYTAQGRASDALPAYKRALDLQPQDAQALADYADALAVANNRSLVGEPEALALRAVKLDPTNVKALSLAGTAAFNRGDFKTAADLWERAVKVSDPVSEFTQQLQAALAEARQRAGLPPLVASTSAAAPATQPAPDVGVAAASVAGRVSLSAAARAAVGPDDTVFIFARAVTGPRMPLAIERRKVSDLPLDFRLDDSMAMSPALRLSTVRQVVIGARVSKSGNATPAAGDWEVTSAPVAVGTQGLRLEIAEPVR